MFRRALLIMLPLTLAACGDKGPAGSAVRVVVKYPGFTPGCVRITASDANGDGSERKERADLGADSDGQWTVAVFRQKDWSNQLRVQVDSFERDCSGEPLETATHEPFLVDNGVKDWEVTLEAQDADDDGFAAATASVKGSDCDDGAAAVNPGAAEGCADVDVDCDGQIGCADADCSGRTCDDGDPCTDDDACTASVCQGTARTCNTPPPGGCHAATGACMLGACEYGRFDAGTFCPFMGDAGVCTSEGVCAPPDVEFDCTDGISNDSDALVDCADFLDCPSGSACNDNDACTVAGTDVCQPDRQCRGTPLDCGPETQCNKPACMNGACVNNPKMGACEDGLSCTSGEMCDQTGVCPMGTSTCTSAPSCHKPLGMCLGDGGCAYEVDLGAACNDSLANTHSDLCIGDGGCQGTAYTCPPPASSCLSGPVYEGDGGCSYPFNPAGTCTVSGSTPGVCLGDGGCVASGGFPYAPSNFVPGVLTPAGAVNLTCAATFDVSTKTFTSSGCSFAVNPVDVTLADGRQAVVLPVSDFDVSSSGSLTFVASDPMNNKPVIIAVFGDADIVGPIRANSARATPKLGPGANFAQCSTSAGENGSGAVNTKGGGGGGGGFGLTGGNGGNGGNGANAGGQGGVAAANLDPVPLRGGCPGGTGGAGGGPGGAGGGAIQISVSGLLKLDSVVSASGAGGVRGEVGDSGGGGGGSGGTVVLEANTINLTSNAVLTANGGGGGGGNKNGGATTSGADGSTTTGTRAAGGAQSGSGTAGGQGGAAAGPATSAANATEGGGGGGGAVGFIYVRHHSTSTACINQAAVKSPALTVQNCSP